MLQKIFVGTPELWKPLDFNSRRAGYFRTFHPMNKQPHQWHLKFAMLSLGDPTYWEERYRHELTKMLRFRLFDWYAPFDLLYPMIENILDRSITHKILLVGIGRSNIVQTLYGQYLFKICLQANTCANSSEYTQQEVIATLRRSIYPQP